MNWKLDNETWAALFPCGFYLLPINEFTSIPISLSYSNSRKEWNAHQTPIRYMTEPCPRGRHYSSCLCLPLPLFPVSTLWPQINNFQFNYFLISKTLNFYKYKYKYYFIINYYLNFNNIIIYIFDCLTI